MTTCHKNIFHNYIQHTMCSCYCGTVLENIPCITNQYRFKYDVPATTLFYKLFLYNLIKTSDHLWNPISPPTQTQALTVDWLPTWSYIFKSLGSFNPDPFTALPLWTKKESIEEYLYSGNNRLKGLTLWGKLKWGLMYWLLKYRDAQNSPGHQAPHKGIDQSRHYH